MSTQFRNLLFTILASLSFINAQADDFKIGGGKNQVTIVYDAKEAKLDSITAYLLQQDIHQVTGVKPPVSTSLQSVKGNAIIIGTSQSKLLSEVLANQNSTLKTNLQGKWECYGYKLISKPTKNIPQALVIAGSDARGTAFGVFGISEKMGVSPWYWWADVPVKKQKTVALNISEFISQTPSVKYRGIFLNDEDWGLQPWAAKTFEPETGDIGPKTYAKIFELLLRLKANLIWPAMHPSTKAFFHYPGNNKMAAAYGIIIGSSHAEPMLRNNVGEWDKSRGAFNYITNKASVQQYWEDRIKESQGINAIYTMGMRGIHDSGMEGVKGPKEAVPFIEQIIADQRAMLQKYINPKVTEVPQAFTAYKEVLDIYDNNLKLPEDITLVWPDDNYGYIHRLNNETEKGRDGGSGVYYHASYWGRPHDYLWLSSTHPGLIRSEMMKAYENKTDRLWVLNVGDLKPLEYNIQFFLDMAYAAEPFKNSAFTKTHLENWTANIFGEKNGKTAAEALIEYYNLAFERRPEFMGWSQTEPTTKTTYSEYNHFYYNDEAQRRLEAYAALEKKVTALKAKISPASADAFYQLVYYPVKGASLINQKFLYRDKSHWYGKQNRLTAPDYAAQSKAAYAQIVRETDYFNNQLAGGKWKHMMAMNPRELPVYAEPELPQLNLTKTGNWNIDPEGYSHQGLPIKPGAPFTLPVFNKHTHKRYFIDIFLTQNQTINWKATVSQPWIKLSEQDGILQDAVGKKELRLWVNIDWSKIKSAAAEGTINIVANDKTLSVTVKAVNNQSGELIAFRGAIEDNGYLALPATQFTRKQAGKNASWELTENIGRTGNSLVAQTTTAGFIAPVSPADIQSQAARAEYDFYTTTAGVPQIRISTLPTHPVNNNYGMRYGVSVDGGPVSILDFKTIGRSNEWKLNVLSNRAIRKVAGPHLSPGKHTLTIYLIDPGVVLQSIEVDMGGLKPAYSIIPATVKRF